MRVVVLGSGAARKSIEELALVVGKILIAEVPIEMPVDPNCQPGLRRFEVHRIRSNERATKICSDRRRAAGRYEASGDRSSAGGTRSLIALPIIFINPVGREQSHPSIQPRGDIHKKEVVSLEVQ